MSYADRAKEARANQGFRPPEGDWKLRFKGAKFERSKKSGNAMISAEFKPMAGPDPVVCQRMKDKDRKLKKRWVMSVDFQFDDLLLFLEELGADLSRCRPLSEDPDFIDLREILDAAEKFSPDCTGTVTHQKDNPQYYNLRLKDVEPVLKPGHQPQQSAVGYQAPAQGYGAGAPAKQQPAYQPPAQAQGFQQPAQVPYGQPPAQQQYAPPPAAYQPPAEQPPAYQPPAAELQQQGTVYQPPVYQPPAYQSPAAAAPVEQQQAPAQQAAPAAAAAPKRPY